MTTATMRARLRFSKTSVVSAMSGREKPLRGHWRAAALHALHVEGDREQVLHVERVHDEVAGDEVLELLDLDAVVLLAPALAPLEQLVDLVARVLEQPEVVVAGRAHRLPALGEQ